MADVTVIILTKNEQVNLPDCLASIRDFASRVVVVDSGSTDATESIARTGGADFYVHPLKIMQDSLTGRLTIPGSLPNGPCGWMLMNGSPRPSAGNWKT